MTEFFYRTTYRTAYVKKPLKPTPSMFTPQEFPDPITIGQKPFLTLEKATPEPPEENGETYFDKFKEKHKEAKHLKKFIEQPLKTHLISQQISEGKASEYQVKFCHSTEEEKKLKKKSFRLSDDAKIELTTQRSSFKNPLDLTPRALDPALVIIPESKLSKGDKLREMLQVKAMESEYSDMIGKMGEVIVRENFKKWKGRGRSR